MFQIVLNEYMLRTMVDDVNESPLFSGLARQHWAIHFLHFCELAEDQKHGKKITKMSLPSCKRQFFPLLGDHFPLGLTF